VSRAASQLRAATRAWQSRPVLQRLRRAMALVRRRTLPQGLLGQAIGYALKRWEALNRFVDDGVLEIDTNLIEHSSQCHWEKEFSIHWTSDAGERSAVIYTLLGSCRRHGVNPFDYLKDLFTRLPAAKITQIKSFTSAAWAKANGKDETLHKAA
jgi:transposase